MRVCTGDGRTGTVLLATSGSSTVYLRLDSPLPARAPGLLPLEDATFMVDLEKCPLWRLQPGPIHVQPFARVVPPVTGKRVRGKEDGRSLPGDLLHRDKKTPARPAAMKPGGPDPASTAATASSASGPTLESQRPAPVVRSACEYAWELEAQARRVSVDDIHELFPLPPAFFDDGEENVCRHKTVEWALRQHDLPAQHGDPPAPCISHVDLGSTEKIRAWVRPESRPVPWLLLNEQRATVVSASRFGALLSDRARAMASAGEHRRVMQLLSRDHVVGLRLDRIDGSRAGQSRWAVVMWDCNRPMIHRVCEVDEPAQLEPSSLRDWMPTSLLRRYFEEHVVARVIDVPPPRTAPSAPAGEATDSSEDPPPASTRPLPGSLPEAATPGPDRDLAPPTVPRGDPFDFVDPQDIGSLPLLREAMAAGEPRLVARTLQALKDQPRFDPAWLDTGSDPLLASLTLRSCDPEAAPTYIDFVLDPDLPLASRQRAGVLREVDPELGLPLLTSMLRELDQDDEADGREMHRRAAFYLHAITRAPDALIDPEDRVQLLLGLADPVPPGASDGWARQPGDEEPALHQLILRDCPTSCRIYTDAILDEATRLLPAQRLAIMSIRSSKNFTPLGMALQAGQDHLYTQLASQVLEAPDSVVPATHKMTIMGSKEGPHHDSHIALALRQDRDQGEGLLLPACLQAILDPRHRLSPEQRTRLLVEADFAFTAWGLACYLGDAEAVETITEAVLSADSRVLPDPSAVLMAPARGIGERCLQSAALFAKNESQCASVGRHLRVALDSPTLTLMQKQRLCASMGGSPPLTAAQHAVRRGNFALARALVDAIKGSTLPPHERMACLASLGLKWAELQALGGGTAEPLDKEPLDEKPLGVKPVDGEPLATETGPGTSGAGKPPA